MNRTNDAEAARGQSELNKSSKSTNNKQKAGQEMGRVRYGMFYGGVTKEEPRRIRYGMFYDGLKKETVINID